jgi:uncharacterized membrane protein
MTDQTPTTEPTDPAEEPVVVAAGVVRDEAGVIAEGGVAIQGDSALLVARFADQAVAGAAYDALRRAESERDLRIDGVLVVDADPDGKIHIRKMTDHHTKRGTVWGAVAGGALALIFPPSILAGAVAGGVIGAAVGKAGNIMTRGQVAAELATVITPGSSGIVALLDLSQVDEVTAAIPEATEVKTVPIDAETADAVKAAAKAAGAETAGA